MLNVYIFGAGMFALGRNTDQYGTILPAVYEFINHNADLEIRINIFVTSKASVERARQDLDRFFKFISRKLEISVSEIGDEESLFSRMSKNPDPKVAILSIPDHLHFHFAKKTLAAGCHTLIVKPFVESAMHANQLINLAKDKNLYGAVEFHKRWDDSNVIARDLIQKNRMGELLSVNVNYSQRREVPLQNFASWADKTTILQYLGSHYIDLTYFLTEAKPLRALAIGEKKLLRSAGINTYDEITSLVEWEHPTDGNFILNLRTGWVDSNDSPAMSNQYVCLSGTNGEVELDQRDRGVRLSLDGSPLEYVNPYFTKSYKIQGTETFKGYGIESVGTFLTDCKRIIDGEIMPEALEGRRPTFRSSLVSVVVIEALLESLKVGSKWVQVSGGDIG